MIHEQVKMQLEHLKSLVDGEKEREEQCKEWNIPYEPSMRKWEDINNYEEYKKEIEQNGDKNLLVMINLKGEGGINMYGVYPFARRYVYMSYGDYFLKHTTNYDTYILFKESEIEVIR